MPRLPTNPDLYRPARRFGAQDREILAELRRSNDLPPGSTIVVPRDVTPLDTRQLILDVSSIFSQFAVSMASLAVLAKQ